MRFFAALYFCVLTGIPANASVPPEIPRHRNSQVFSPFFFQGENGELVLGTGGPFARSYDLRSSLQVGSPVPGERSHVTREDFYEFLTTPAGILFWSSHGDPTRGDVVVEGFSRVSEGGCTDAGTVLEGYLNNQVFVSTNEARVTTLVGTDPYCVLTVAPIYIERIQAQNQMAEHSIVIGASCGALALGDSFISTTRRVRNFIGYNGLGFSDGLFNVADGRQLAESILNNMAGVADDLGSIANHHLRPTITLAQSLVPNSGWRLDTTPPDAGGLRLYNAPRLVLADLRQDTDANGTFDKLLYRYVFGQDIYPYDRDSSGNRLDYPSDGVKSGNPLAGPGALEVVLRFSEPMDSGFPDFEVKSVLEAGGGTPASFSPIGGVNGWTPSGHMPKSSVLDTWRGQLSSTAGLQDGKQIIRIRARHAPPNADSGSLELDTNGDGESGPGTFDTSVNIIRKRLGSLDEPA